MKLFRKIDTITGSFLEDVGFESHPFLMEIVTETITHEDETTEEVTSERPLLNAEGNVQLDPQYVAEPIPSGVYAVSGICPQWNGIQWIENVQAPVVEPGLHEPSVDERLDSLEDVMLFLI